MKRFSDTHVIEELKDLSYNSPKILIMMNAETFNSIQILYKLNTMYKDIEKIHILTDISLDIREYVNDHNIDIVINLIENVLEDETNMELLQNDMHYGNFCCYDKNKDQDGSLKKWFTHSTLPYAASDCYYDDLNYNNIMEDNLDIKYIQYYFYSNRGEDNKHHNIKTYRTLIRAINHITMQDKFEIVNELPDFDINWIKSKTSGLIDYYGNFYQIIKKDEILFTCLNEYYEIQETVKAPYDCRIVAKSSYNYGSGQIAVGIIDMTNDSIYRNFTL